MKDFNQLIERSYQAIKDRGLIKPETKKQDFVLKMHEELDEIKTEIFYYDGFDSAIEKYIEECIDLATVCFMQVKHLGYDPINEFEKVVIKNEKRANK